MSFIREIWEKDIVVTTISTVVSVTVAIEIKDSDVTPERAR